MAPVLFHEAIWHIDEAYTPALYESHNLELKPIFDVLDTNSTHEHTHRIFLKIVKLRSIYFSYTILYSQNLIWPQNFILIVDVTMFKTFV